MMRISEKELNLIQSVISDDLTYGYAQYLLWENRTDFNGRLTLSENLYLPFVYKKYFDQFKFNEKQKLIEGLSKKNIFVNAITYKTIGQISHFLRVNSIEFTFINEIATKELLELNNSQRKITNIECLLPQTKIKKLSIFLNQIGFTMLEKNPTKKIGQVSFYRVGHPKITIHFWPVKFHDTKVNIDWFIKKSLQVSSNNIATNVINQEALFIQKTINLPFESHWYNLADCILLQKQYSIEVNSIIPFLEQSSTRDLYSEFFNHLPISLNLKLFKIDKAKPNTYTFINLLLESRQENYIRTFKGRIAAAANRSGVNGNKIYNLPSWIKIIENWLNKKKLF